LRRPLRLRSRLGSDCLGPNRLRPSGLGMGLGGLLLGAALALALKTL